MFSTDLSQDSGRAFVEFAPLERPEPHRSGAVSVCPAHRHFSLRSWLHVQMAKAELRLCSMPAPAPGQLFSTQRQTGRERECASPFPLLAYLRKSSQLLLISSLPFLRTQNAGSQRAGEEGRRAGKRLQDGWCWPTSDTSAALAPCHSPSDIPVKGKLVAPA